MAILSLTDTNAAAFFLPTETDPSGIFLPIDTTDAGTFLLLPLLVAYFALMINSSICCGVPQPLELFPPTASYLTCPSTPSILTCSPTVPPHT